MTLLSWFTRSVLRISGTIEEFARGRFYQAIHLRGAREAVDFIRVQPPLHASDFSILHISDLHFGRHHPEKVDHLRRHIYKRQPNMIVVSGDIADTPTDANYRTAKAFLDDIRTHTSCLLLAPGNHDRHGEIDLTKYMDGLDLARGPYDCKLIELNDDFWVTAFVLNSTPAMVAPPSNTPKALRKLSSGMRQSASEICESPS